MTYPTVYSLVQHTTLFAACGVLTGLAFAPIISYYDQSFKENNAYDKTNLFLVTSWIAAAVFTIVLFLILLFDTNTSGNGTSTAQALTPIGMMIAALIASASVMKNIAETKAHDIAKSEKEKLRKRVFAFNIIETINLTVESLSETIDKELMVVLHLDFKENMQTVNKLLESIFSESILPFISESEQNKILVFYRNFAKFSFIKQLSHPSLDNDKDIEEFILLIQDYKKLFTKLSQEYIEEYKNTKES